MQLTTKRLLLNWELEKSGYSVTTLTDSKLVNII